jgi:hypothetical protein
VVGFAVVDDADGARVSTGCRVVGDAVVGAEEIGFVVVGFAVVGNADGARVAAGLGVFRVVGEIVGANVFTLSPSAIIPHKTALP